MAEKKPILKTNPLSLNTSQSLMKSLIISDSSSLGRALALKLLKKGVEVYYLKVDGQPSYFLKKLKKEKHFHVLKKYQNEKFDYVFQVTLKSLKETKVNPLKVFQFCSQNESKYLFATTEKEIYPSSFFLPLTHLKPANWRLVYFDFVYGPKVMEENFLGLTFSQIHRHKLLLVTKNETALYPLYLDDFIEGLLRAMFSVDSHGKTYYLTGLEKINFLDFILKIKQKVDKPLKPLILKPEKELKFWQIENSLLGKIKKSWGQLLYLPRVKLDEGLEKSLKDALVQSDFFSFNFLKVKKKNFLIFFFSFLVVIFLSLLPLIFFSVFGAWGFFNLKKAETNFKKQQFSNVKKLTNSAEVKFELAQQIFQEFPWYFNLFLGKKVKIVEDFLGLALDLNKSLVLSQEVAENFQTFGRIVLENVLENKAEDPQEKLNQLLVALESWEEKLAFAQIKSQSLSQADLPKFLDISYLNELNQTLPSLRQKIIFASRLLSLTPRLLAFEDKKTYLVLLQNNSELRPTGGFLGSFALVTFEKGRLLDIRVEDVYNADGQLKGYVEPPEALKKYLDKNNWFMRDANWSPDFPTAARQVAWFLEKETGQKTEGVIGINLNLIKSLLAVLGPVDLPDYQEQINSQNLFERAEYYSEINFFPGSTQKKSFLSTLANFLFEKMKTAPLEVWFSLLEQLPQNLAAKDLMFYDSDFYLQTRFQSFGWAGEIKKINFSSQSQFPGPGMIDYLMPVEANLGINKANYFLDRKIEYEVTLLKEGQVKIQLTLIYDNQSPSESWPGGTYKNYLRLLLPVDVSGIEVEEKQEGENRGKILSQEKIEKEKAFSKNIFGFLVEIPAQSKKRIIITYQRGLNLSYQNKVFDYLFFLQKQSGTKNDPVLVKINYPLFLKPAKVMPKAEFKPQQLEFKSEFNQDLIFAVEFSH